MAVIFFSSPAKFIQLVKSNRNQITNRQLVNDIPSIKYMINQNRLTVLKPVKQSPNLKTCGRWRVAPSQSQKRPWLWSRTAKHSLDLGSPANCC